LTLDGGFTTPAGTHIVVGAFSTLVMNTGSLVLVGGSSLSMSNGADATLGALRIGQAGGNGTASFDGPGTTVQTTVTNSPLQIGLNGFTGRADFTNGAVGTFAGGIGLSQSNASSIGTLTISTGAQVTTGGNVNLGTGGFV